MQLDKTRILIRERSYTDLMDLSLHVIRGHALGILLTSLAGAAPMVLFNIWWFSDWVPERDMGEFADEIIWYVVAMLFFTTWQVPLASAATTLYLGQVLFLEKTSYAKLARDVLRALPQLLLLQVGPRAVMPLLCFSIWHWADNATLALVFLFMLPPLLYYWIWPYLNEVILLERNPLTRRRAPNSTLSRNKALHAHNRGDLFARWLMATVVGFCWIAALWLAMYWVRLNLGKGRYWFDWSFYVIYLQVAVWLVLSYFTVVRYLSYLDLRIRNEGWEIELSMRAEAARLARQIT